MKCSQCKEYESIDGHIICAACFIDNGEKGMTTMTTNPHNQLTAAVGEIAVKIHGRFCDSKVHDSVGCVKSIRDYEHEISTNTSLLEMANDLKKTKELVYLLEETPENYQELLNQRDTLQTQCAELQERVGELEKDQIKIPLATVETAKDGWHFNYTLLQALCELTNHSQDGSVSMEQVDCILYHLRPTIIEALNQTTKP